MLEGGRIDEVCRGTYLMVACTHVDEICKKTSTPKYRDPKMCLHEALAIIPLHQRLLTRNAGWLDPTVDGHSLPDADVKTRGRLKTDIGIIPDGKNETSSNLAGAVANARGSNPIIKSERI